MIAVDRVAVPQNNNSQISHQRLERAAQQFESMFLGELLKPLNESESEEEGTAMKSFATEAVAAAMTQQSHLGFASRIVGAIEGREKVDK